MVKIWLFKFLGSFKTSTSKTSNNWFNFVPFGTFHCLNSFWVQCCRYRVHFGACEQVNCWTNVRPMSWYVIDISYVDRVKSKITKESLSKLCLRIGMLNYCHLYPVISLSSNNLYLSHSFASAFQIQNWCWMVCHQTCGFNSEA